ncbi:MAG: hypothetical protein AABX03_02775 [Nanoarchaeota archaeon]
MNFKEYISARKKEVERLYTDKELIDESRGRILRQISILEEIENPLPKLESNARDFLTAYMKIEKLYSITEVIRQKIKDTYGDDTPLEATIKQFDIQAKLKELREKFSLDNL